MFDLSGKTSLVTGASGGIGRAIALALAEQGAAVALAGTRQTALEETAQLIKEQCPQSQIAIICADLSQEGGPESIAKQAEAALGSIGILVNNAGITRDNLAMRMSDDDWAQVINVNLFSSFKLSKALMRGMMKQRWGRIISITSVVGQTGNPGQANYAAAKAGLVGMSKALAQELASRNITVNCVAPGFIVTAMTNSLDDQQKGSLLEKIPARKLGDPRDIATAVAFLASSESAYITGQTLHVNGGMAMI